MEGVTLLESKTPRAHFAFVKRLEASKSAKEADVIIQKAIEEAKDTLQSKNISALSESTIFSQLLVLLHCIQSFPHAEDFVPFDLSFALLPTLHLLATTNKSNGLQIAYSMLAYLIGPGSNGLESSSLLVLNTIRQHLSLTKQNERTSKTLRYSRQYFALRSIIIGTPSGSDTVPALYGPIFGLLNDGDYGIKALAIEALLVLNSYRHDEEDRGIAKATYEQIRGVVRASKKGKAKERQTRASKDDSEGLQRAFIKASTSAIQQKIITLEEYVEAITSIIEPYSTNWLKINIIKSLIAELSKEGEKLQDTLINTVLGCLTTNFVPSLDQNPLLLESARLIGLFESSPPSTTKETVLHAIWAPSMEHLTSKNANRRVLALDIMGVLLPFQWQLPDSTINLNEDQMQAFMELLGDIDDTIRKRSLRLLYLIDPIIVNGHLDALEKAASEESKSIDEVVLLILRACESLHCFSEGKDDNSLSTVYATKLVALLQNPQLQETMNEQIVLQITRDWQNAPLQQTVQAVNTLIKRLTESERKLSPTCTLLIATLICELFRSSPKGEVDQTTYSNILRNIATLQSSNEGENVALQEAMLIASIKLFTMINKSERESILPLYTKIAEASSSTLIKERIRQMEKLTSFDVDLEDLEYISKRASLLTTLDRIDSYMIHGSSRNKMNGKLKNKDRAPPKPLQFDAYETPIASEMISATSPNSSVHSSKKSQPFHTLPTPSQMRNQRLSERKAHAAIEKTMQKSIAQMILGDDDDDLEYDTTTATTIAARDEIQETETDADPKNNIPKEGILFE